MQDWEAGLVAYIVALLIAQTEAAPVAVVGAWGVAIFMVLETAKPGALAGLVSGVTGAAKGKAVAPTQTAAQGEKQTESQLGLPQGFLANPTITSGVQQP